MTDYIYRGFKIHYMITPVKNELKLYQANGFIECLRDRQQDKQTPRQKFHTESNSSENVQLEIKKMIEDYIDFEWQEFEKMQEEKE